MTEDYKECGWNNNGNCLAYPDMCAEIDDCEHKQLKQAENTVNECHKYLAELEDKIESLEQENKELKSETLQWKQIKDMANNNNYRSALEEIREICRCSKEPMNCDECPQNDDCEELCVNDENLQDIIYDKITEVLNLS